MLMPFTVSAASKKIPSKNTQKKLYREFIEKRTPTITTVLSSGKSYTRKYKIDAFVLLDMDKNGIYELFTIDDSFNKKFKTIRNTVFTIRKGKVKEWHFYDNSRELHKGARKIFYNYKERGVVGEAYIRHGLCNTLIKCYKSGDYLTNFEFKYTGNKPPSSLVTNIHSYPYRNNNAHNRDKYLKVSVEKPQSAVSKKYQVVYNANGGKNEPSLQKFKLGDRVKLSSQKPVRRGYSFLGWSRSSKYKKASYYSGKHYKFNKSVILYAVWKECS